MIDKNTNNMIRMLCIGLMAGMILAVIAGSTTVSIAAITFYGTMLGCILIIASTFLIKPKGV